MRDLKKPDLPLKLLKISLHLILLEVHLVALEMPFSYIIEIAGRPFGIWLYIQTKSVLALNSES